MSSVPNTWIYWNWGNIRSNFVKLHQRTLQLRALSTKKSSTKDLIFMNCFFLSWPEKEEEIIGRLLTGRKGRVHGVERVKKTPKVPSSPP